MPKSKSKKRDLNQALGVFKKLQAYYPSSKTELTYENPFQLLVAVMLSAQCTDARVNLTTPALFKVFPDAKAMAGASLKEIEKLIHSCGFYRMKALALKTMSQSLLDQFNGKVPETLEELVQLRGVGRKTASVMLNQAFDKPAIAVDTHVKRVAHRLGWTVHRDNADIIERELKEFLPEEIWVDLNGLLVLHGRRLCKAGKPRCFECPVAALCPFEPKNLEIKSQASLPRVNRT